MSNTQCMLVLGVTPVSSAVPKAFYVDLARPEERNWIAKHAYPCTLHGTGMLVHPVANHAARPSSAPSVP